MKQTIGNTVLISVIAFLFISSAITSGARPYFVPTGANWRIDQVPGNSNCTMEWYELSNHGDWGQGQCSMAGNSCHCYDWVTWWYPTVEPPDPPEGTTPIYGDEDFPTYNPDTGKYEY